QEPPSRVVKGRLPRVTRRCAHTPSKGNARNRIVREGGYVAGKLGIGIVSFAHGHVNAYAHQIKTFEDAQLVACWDDDEERGKQNAEAFGIPITPHLEDLLSPPASAGVIIASETNRHADLCLAAMEAGKSVLLQKPMAITLAD